MVEGKVVWTTSSTDMPSALDEERGGSVQVFLDAIAVGRRKRRPDVVSLLSTTPHRVGWIRDGHVY